MEKPYFKITTSSSNSAVLIDRRLDNDEQTYAMRQRLLQIGCKQEELTQEERDLLIKNEKGLWI